EEPPAGAMHARILAAPEPGREIVAVLRHLLSRLAVGAAVVAGVVALTFLLLHAAPGNPVDYLLGPTATPSQISADRHRLARNGLACRVVTPPLLWPRRSGRRDSGRSTWVPHGRGALDRYRHALRRAQLLAGADADHARDVSVEGVPRVRRSRLRRRFPGGVGPALRSRALCSPSR